MMKKSGIKYTRYFKNVNKHVFTFFQIQSMYHLIWLRVPVNGMRTNTRNSQDFRYKVSTHDTFMSNNIKLKLKGETKKKCTLINEKYYTNRTERISYNHNKNNTCYKFLFLVLFFLFFLKRLPNIKFNKIQFLKGSAFYIKSPLSFALEDDFQTYPYAHSYTRNGKRKKSNMHNSFRRYWKSE